MTTATIEDNWIETRFVWGRCAAKDARAVRELIRAFQSDAWPAATCPTIERKSKRSSHR